MWCEVLVGIKYILSCSSEAVFLDSLGKSSRFCDEVSIIITMSEIMRVHNTRGSRVDIVKSGGISQLQNHKYLQQLSSRFRTLYKYFDKFQLQTTFKTHKQKVLQVVNSK